ncbi:MAG: hypothetical protein NZ553_01780 [Caldilinea sp.]|nr:hypothetical protein [Caldilinea sp.]MDW8439180.1 hypothetical protein [Caldilineaceae bacterium]
MASYVPTNPLVRIAGRDPSLATVAADAQLRTLPMVISCVAPSPDEDYALLDPTLSVAPIDFESLSSDEPAPAPGLSYNAFTSRQRSRFLAWVETPLTPAPPAFQQLYLAALEVRLLEGGAVADAALAELLRLRDSEAWSRTAGFWRTALLAAWLRQDGALLAEWMAAAPMPVELMGVALGLQALLATPLSAAEVRQVLEAWKHAPLELPESALALRLNSLTAALGEDPLQHALERLGETAHALRPWRCQHCDLRIHLPQPDLRRVLEPLLRELTSIGVAEAQPPDVQETLDASDNKTQEELALAHVILEFRQSRSEYFPFVLHLAQKRAGFMQLLDEDRHLVYRVAFRKSEMSAFWQLWSYVQSWSATRVYCKGKELKKWQVDPYSKYLR